MTFHVVYILLLLLERGSAQVTGVRLVFGVGSPNVAVVGGVGGEGLPAVLTLEGPFSGVLADVCAQNTGGGEGLDEEGINTVSRLIFFFRFSSMQLQDGQHDSGTRDILMIQFYGCLRH